jgi:aflatoxin B1 aldehyde reductase
MVGRVLKPAAGTLRIATKAHPSEPGGLSPGGLTTQLEKSLAAMKVQAVDVLYLHQPDGASSLKETMQAATGLVEQGLVSSLGISNFSTVETERLFKMCASEGFSKPTVFQGLYNPINRRVEADLLPLLRQHGVSFVAYNPLAAGLLTGKHSRGAPPPEGRFKDNPNYLDRFYRDSDFDALAIIQAACDLAGLSMVEASYSWLLHDSSLTGDDGLLIGASCMDHLTANLEACRASQPLPKEVLDAFDAAWKVAEPNAFAFWRGFSADQPGCEDLDQGSAYAVSK